MPKDASKSLLVLVLLLAAPAWAQAESPRFEITPFVGGRVGGGFDVETTDGSNSSVDLGSGVSYGVDVGLYRDPQSYYELLYSAQSASLDSKDPALDGIDVSVDYLQFGGTAFFPQDSSYFIPWVSLTIGATFMKPDTGDYDSETKFSGTLGTGLRIPFNDNVALNLGLRGYLTFLSSDTSMFCVSDSGDAGCLVKSSGSTFFQGEAQLGLSVRF